jgi:hypothetical protein
MSNNNLFQERNKPPYNFREYRDLNTQNPQYQYPNRQQKQVEQRKEEKPARIEERHGMSNGVWGFTLAITEIILDIIKAIMVVGGIVAANLADVIFGTVGITILFGGSSALFNGTPVWVIGLILSMGASAVQIFLWSLIQKRGIGISQILKWKRLPEDIKMFMSMALVVWVLDTLIDMSPIALLVQNSQYESITPLYFAMIGAVSIIVFILCGFSEIMTSNMRAMLMAGSDNSKKNSQQQSNNQTQQYQSVTRNIPNSIPRRK